jgi:hypothetical protein
VARPANFTPWTLAPHHIAGLGSSDDPIPIVPPEGYVEGGAAIYRARTKEALKTIPDWELLAYFLRGPDLVFLKHDRTWHLERWKRLYELRRAARQAAKDGDPKRYARLLGATRFRWRVLVQRSVGIRLMGGQVVLWR